jgi:hypothetical protein
MSTALATTPRTAQHLLSERIARLIADTHLDTVPDEVVEYGKRLLLGTVAT